MKSHASGHMLGKHPRFHFGAAFGINPSWTKTKSMR